MKLRIKYDPKWGLALSDNRMKNEFKELVEYCEDWRNDPEFTFHKSYANFKMVYLTILLYVRGKIDHKDITYIIDGEDHKLNRYGVIEDLPDSCGREEIDAALETAKFAMKIRRKERKNKID